jgi:hypothetical protein
MIRAFLFVLGLAIGSIATLHWGEFTASNDRDREYKTAEQDVSNALLKIKADIEAGLTRDAWNENHKTLELAGGKLRIFKKMENIEAGALSKTLRFMRSTSTVWRLQEECKQQIKPDCLERLVETLWFSGASIKNAAFVTGADDRRFISSANCTLDEFRKSYLGSDENKNPFSGSAVSSLMGDVSLAIQSYFSAKGIFIE